MLVGFPYLLLNEAHQLEARCGSAFSACSFGYVEDVEVGKHLHVVVDGKYLGECTAQYGKGCQYEHIFLRNRLAQEKDFFQDIR